MDQAIQTMFKEIKRLCQEGSIKNELWNISDENLFRISCSIQKHSPGGQIDCNPSLPVVHKNTLGQILYESFIDQRFNLDSPVLPVILILSKNTVDGINIPGFYLFSPEDSLYTLVGGINENHNIWSVIEGIRHQNGIHSNLAIGYSINIPRLKTDNNYNPLRNTINNLTSKVSHMLEIHGELKDLCIYVSSSQAGEAVSINNFMLCPIYITQWIVKK